MANRCGNTRRKRSRVVIVDSVRFLSRGPGNYHAEGGEFAIVHMFAGEVQHQWELYALGADGEIVGDPIDIGIALADFRLRAQSGRLLLRGPGARRATK